MKKAILVISLSTIFAINALAPVIAQDQPKPKKDTVNIDTDAKPTFYYEIEDDKATSEGSGKSSKVMIIVIAAVVITGGAVGYYIVRNKK